MQVLVLVLSLSFSKLINLSLTLVLLVLVRYDATENCTVTDLSQQRRILKRRYGLK